MIDGDITAPVLCLVGQETEAEIIVGEQCCQYEDIDREIPLPITPLPDYISDVLGL